MMPFHQILTKQRIVRGLGTRELSRLLNISHTHLRRLESDISRPSEELVRKLAETLKLNFDDLMISANRIPVDIQEYLLRNPSELRRIRAQITTE